MPGSRLEWGPPGGPRIEVVGPGPPDLALPAPWDVWYRCPEKDRLAPADRPLRGVLGRYPEGTVVAFRYPPPMSPRLAIHILATQAPGDAGPPPALLAACLAAAEARRLPVRLAPAVFARLAQAGRPPADPARALLLGWPLPLPALRRLAGLLLRPGPLRRLARLPAVPEGAANLFLLGAAAAELAGLSELSTPTGLRLPLPASPAAAAGTFAAWLEFLRGGLTPAAFAFFYPDGFEPPEIPAQQPQAPARDPGDEALRAGLKRALLAEAAAAAGAFGASAGAEGPGSGAAGAARGLELAVPRELEPLLGPGRLVLLADGEGLWVRLPRLGLPVRWEPGRPFRPLLVADPLGDLVLAALWRDLRAGGPRAFGSGPAGVRLWGTYEEWALLGRAAAVRPHLRRLPPHGRASPAARELAAAYGLVLPWGFTFVRPHLRAGAAAGAFGASAGAEGGCPGPGRQPAARGLLSLALLVGCGFRGRRAETAGPGAFSAGLPEGAGRTASGKPSRRSSPGQTCTP